MSLIKEQLNQEKLEEMRAVVRTITGYMVLPLYLIFWVTDIFYAPQYKWEFLFLRCLVIPVALFSNWFITKAKTLQAAQNIALAYIFCLAAILDVMIFIMAEPTSPYYTGLILVAIGGLGFFPWSRQYFFYVVALVFIPYIAVVLLLNPGVEDLAYFVVIGFFINGTITILWVIQLFREKLRTKEITARSNLNAEIEKRKEVEDELREARDQALKTSHSKSIFLANMSHELRTPLTAIIGYGELLEDEVNDNSHQVYLKDLKKINSAGNHLLHLINGVLDISKIESGQMDILSEKFNLAVMMKMDESIFDSITEKNNNIFSIECPDNIGVMETDETKLRQILYNIISNAGKFTRDGIIKLKISELNINGQEWIKFILVDNGIGMTAEQSEKVFEAFVQADSSTTKKFGGTGLGLSISWHFCKMLGGELFLQSKEGKGSVFIVLLPRQLNSSQDKISHAELKEIAFQNTDSHVFD